MNPVDIIVIAVVALIVGAVSVYLYRAKKRGAKCIGCPDGSKCSGNCSGGVGCGAKPTDQ